MAAHEMLAQRGEANPPADRRRAGSGQSGLDPAVEIAALAAAAGHRIARPCRRYPRRLGKARISRCCRRGARACPKACWKPRPAGGRSSRPTFRAAARSRAPMSMPCWCRRTMPPALADAIARLARDADLRRRFGAAGRGNGRRRVFAASRSARKRGDLRPRCWNVDASYCRPIAQAAKQAPHRALRGH